MTNYRISHLKLKNLTKGFQQQITELGEIYYSIQEKLKRNST